MDNNSRETFNAHFDTVTIRTETDETGYQSLTVTPVWKGVDRPNVGGWGLKLEHGALAVRLARAIREGAAFSKVEKCVDVNGHTYISASHTILGRKMNADLTRLGY